MNSEDSGWEIHCRLPWPAECNSVQGVCFEGGGLMMTWQILSHSVYQWACRPGSLKIFQGLALLLLERYLQIPLFISRSFWTFTSNIISINGTFYLYFLLFPSYNQHPNHPASFSPPPSKSSPPLEIITTTTSKSRYLGLFLNILFGEPFKYSSQLLWFVIASFLLFKFPVPMPANGL